MICNTKTAKYYSEAITEAHADFYSAANGVAYYNFACKNPKDALTGSSALVGSSIAAFFTLLAMQ